MVKVQVYFPPLIMGDFSHRLALIGGGPMSKSEEVRIRAPSAEN